MSGVEHHELLVRLDDLLGRLPQAFSGWREEHTERVTEAYAIARELLRRSSS